MTACTLYTGEIVRNALFNKLCLVSSRLPRAKLCFNEREFRVLDVVKSSDPWSTSQTTHARADCNFFFVSAPVRGVRSVLLTTYHPLLTQQRTENFCISAMYFDHSELTVFLYPSPRAAGTGTKCSFVHVCVCGYMSPTPRKLNWRSWNLVHWLTMSGVGLLQSLEALAAMQIVGVRSEMSGGVTKIRLNLLPRWNIIVNFRDTGRNYTPIASSLRAESTKVYVLALFATVWRQIQKICFWKEDCQYIRK